VAGRHVHTAGQRLDVEGLGMFAIDPVANAAKQREVTQVLSVGGSAGHLTDRAI
jgi:hypothetical protein